MRELFIEAFSSFVPNIKSFGLHSLRAGGATAACNFGISDRLFKRHGRWKSETAKNSCNGYTEIIKKQNYYEVKSHTTMPLLSQRKGKITEINLMEKEYLRDSILVKLIFYRKQIL
jgi:hypothetical protein